MGSVVAYAAYRRRRPWGPVSARSASRQCGVSLSSRGHPCPLAAIPVLYTPSRSSQGRASLSPRSAAPLLFPFLSSPIPLLSLSPLPSLLSCPLSHPSPIPSPIPLPSPLLSLLSPLPSPSPSPLPFTLPLPVSPPSSPARPVRSAAAARLFLAAFPPPRRPAALPLRHQFSARLAVAAPARPPSSPPPGWASGPTAAGRVPPLVVIDGALPCQATSYVSRRLAPSGARPRRPAAKRRLAGTRQPPPARLLHRAAVHS